jgi:hypothetical protein
MPGWITLQHKPIYRADFFCVMTFLDIACVWSLEAWWCRSQGLHRATPSLHGRALLRRARTTIEIDGTRSISC